jgi:predicted aminopeptidase
MFRAVLLALLGLLLSGCYVLRQGTVLLSHQKAAVPLETLRAEEFLATETRAFLDLVEDIRRFGTGELGLAGSRNYTTYVEIDRDYLVDVVSASKADRFERRTWWFPFFGSFPYKGFYNRAGAERLAGRLRRRRLDVLVRKVDAFSTLGFFRDPIYSFMLGYSDFEMAQLILHEQAHATVFLKNRIQFNEELATFVGNEGALAFLRERDGPQSESYAGALASLEDQRVFVAQVRGLALELERLYAEDLPREQILAEKQRTIQDYQQRFLDRYDGLFGTDRYRGFGEVRINNAYLDLYRTYTQDLEVFYRLYENEERNLRATIEVLKQVGKAAPEHPKSYMHALLTDAEPPEQPVGR